MAKRKTPKRPMNSEIAALVEWLNEKSLRLFLADEVAARRYLRIRDLLCELDRLKAAKQVA